MTNSKIQDDNTTLTGIPAEAWAYTLGNRSALEWVLDQYKDSSPQDATLAAQFDTYRFALYKEQVIALLCKVCRVSLETQNLIKQMP
jgi:predicted helicase